MALLNAPGDKGSETQAPAIIPHVRISVMALCARLLTHGVSKSISSVPEPILICTPSAVRADVALICRTAGLWTTLMSLPVPSVGSTSARSDSSTKDHFLSRVINVLSVRCVSEDNADELSCDDGVGYSFEERVTVRDWLCSWATRRWTALFMEWVCVSSRVRVSAPERPSTSVFSKSSSTVVEKSGATPGYPAAPAATTKTNAKDMSCTVCSWTQECLQSCQQEVDKNLRRASVSSYTRPRLSVPNCSCDCYNVESIYAARCNSTINEAAFRHLSRVESSAFDWLTKDTQYEPIYTEAKEICASSCNSAWEVRTLLLSLLKVGSIACSSGSRAGASASEKGITRLWAGLDSFTLASSLNSIMGGLALAHSLDATGTFSSEMPDHLSAGEVLHRSNGLPLLIKSVSEHLEAMTRYGESIQDFLRLSSTVSSKPTTLAATSPIELRSSGDVNSSENEKSKPEKRHVRMKSECDLSDLDGAEISADAVSANPVVLYKDYFATKAPLRPVPKHIRHSSASTPALGDVKGLAAVNRASPPSSFRDTPTLPQPPLLLSLSLQHIFSALHSAFTPVQPQGLPIGVTPPLDIYAGGALYRLLWGQRINKSKAKTAVQKPSSRVPSSRNNQGVQREKAYRAIGAPNQKSRSVKRGKEKRQGTGTDLTVLPLDVMC